jgi:G3E family GTPase
MISTNLITGFLGVGKTTAVIDLLRHKPPGSRWAVLVNEYGDVTIDGALIEGSSPDGVTVREVGGGCVCCASAPYLQVALHFLLLDAKPERLILETTGLGHPARLLDTLRHDYRDRLDLRATLCLVDPADFARPEMRTNPVFVDQVQLADVVVMNKLDTASPELVADFQAWANGIFPPKLLIAGTTHGRLDPAWLDLTASDERLPVHSEAHAHPERPPTAVGGQHGWIFPTTDVFDEDQLLALLGAFPGVIRLKGVFRVQDDWIAVNRTGSGLTTTPTAYRRDSRVEVFADSPDWDAFERGLSACRLSR